MEKRDLAVTVQNFVQFYSIKAGIDELIKMNYTVDIYIPMAETNTGIENLFDDTYNKMLNMNYSIKRTSDLNLSYKILLEPYPMDIYLKFNYQYRIKYKYAPISAKPNLTLNPENNIYYDCILCSGDYEANYLSVYSKTKTIGNLKYINFTKETTNTEKPILLYLPTYGDTCSIDLIINILMNLREDYYIITKLHHGTSYLHNELHRINKIKDLSNEVCNHDTPIIDLLKKANVVLSDNSGSIFEAIYANVPVAVFSSDPNSNKIGNFDTTQYKYIKKGYIPYTNQPSEIKNILKSALSEEFINKQLNLKEILFGEPITSVNNFVSVIKDYLDDNIDFNYKNMHDVLVNNYKNMHEALINSYNENETLIRKNNENINMKDEEINNLKKEIDKLNELITFQE